MTKLTPEQEAALDAMRARKEGNSPPSVLNDEERRRIREEELYRAQVRGEYAQQSVRASAPSYWVGFWLNAIVFGIGFFVIGEVAWGAVWLIAAIVLNLSTSFISWPFLAVGVLIHYRSVYAKKYGT